MHRLAVFDMDGTLLDTLGDLQRAGNYSLNSLGFPTHADREAYRHFIGNGLRNQLFQSLPENARSDENIKKMRDIYMPYYEAHITDNTYIYDGVATLIEQLSTKGIKLAIFSNKPDHYVSELAEHFFPGAFSLMVGHREGKPAKPDPSGLLEIIRQLGFEKEDCIYIGDSYVDAKTGQNAGVDTAVVSWGYCTKEQLIEAGALHIFDNCDELLNFIVDN